VLFDRDFQQLRVADVFLLVLAAFRGTPAHHGNPLS
jgi:hypothetical protein